MRQLVCHEMEKRELSYQRHVKIPVEYDGIELGVGFRADLIVDRSVVVELKSVESLTPLHKKKLLNHLKLTKLRLGLLDNFNVPLLRDGIVRMANHLEP
jgi:GxxExxY protein